MKCAVCFSILFFTISVFSADKPAMIYAPADLPADPIIKPNQPIPIERIMNAQPRQHPRRDDFIGERVEVGNTWFDYQSNGSVGKMIKVDPDGNVHVTWMDAADQEWEQRHQKYNCRMDGEWMGEDGFNVDDSERSGYGCLCLTNEDEPRAIVFCHILDGDGQLRSYAFLDFFPGWGAFIPTMMPGNTTYPQGVLSRDGIIHTVAWGYDEEVYMLYYAAGAINDAGEAIEFFDDEPIEIGETNINTYRIARSPNSERAAIIFPNTRFPGPDWMDFLAYQMNNDLFLVWTDDGENWNFDEPFNITRCIEPDPEREGDLAYGDTLLPYATFDLIFDADDNIHVVFGTRGFWQNPDGEGEPPVDRLSVDASFLFHWSEETDLITPVADGWFSQLDGDERPQPGAWKSNVSNPSLALDENGDLYCVFEYYPHGVHENGYCFADLMVTVSEDNGETWFYPTKIVETPAEQNDDPFSEIYPTVAERVDDFLHIFYEEDQAAGNFVQDEGVPVTLNSFFYHTVPIDEIQRDSIWLGPAFHFDEERLPEFYHELLISELTFNGEPAPDGWGISVYTEEGEQAGNCIWSRDGVRLLAIGDNPRTEEVEGFHRDESFEFRVFDPDAGEEYPADALFIEGREVWFDQAVSTINLNAYEVEEQMLELVQGWNMISLNVIPEGEDLRVWDEVSMERAVEEYIDQIDDENNHLVILIKGINGDFCVPEWDFWGIDAWEMDQGYLFKVSEDCAPVIPGRRIDPQTGIQLHIGWNIVPYFPNYELPFEWGWDVWAFESIHEHVIIVKDGQGHFYVEGIQWELPPCRPGQGYQILVDADCVLIYPEEMEERIAVKPENYLAPRHWQASNTGENMSLFLASIIGFEVEDGYEIGAFSMDGRLVGSGLIKNGRCGLAVWGDDVYSEETDGMKTGEKFILKVWDPNNRNECDLTVSAFRRGTGLVYEPNGLLTIDAAVNILTPNEFYLAEPYPNPFNSATRIEFGLPVRSEVVLAVYDAGGRMITELINGEFNAGCHKTTWTAANLPGGIYFLKITASGFSDVRKIVLIR